MGLTGCFLTSDLPADSPTAAPTVTTLLTQDAADVMSGVCFEAAFDAAGHIFVLRSTAELIHLFDLADNSRLCRQPVERHTFDFENGRILAGVWSAGTGCTARHEVIGMSRDDAAKQVTIRARFIVDGDCGYELVRPFWLALDRVTDYAVDIQVEDEE
jgi:hypothetical protein